MSVESTTIKEKKAVSLAKHCMDKSIELGKNLILSVVVDQALDVKKLKKALLPKGSKYAK
jgi:hypothetical protein